MPYIDKPLACADCAAQLTLTAEGQQEHTGPCFQRGPRRSHRHYCHIMCTGLAVSASSTV